MISRMSTLLLPTMREAPAEAEIPSHRALLRAGYIRRAAPGIYSWLPLGLRVLTRVTAIVREEMNAIGADEVLFPALLPRDLYEVTGRWQEYGELLFRLSDRRGAEYLLGPTHEEMFTTLVKAECHSYRDYPRTLYQIQTKYRDEARPRAGILRGREFIMKDSYSFDLDDLGLETSYQRHRAAYQRIFNRLGIDHVIVSAVSGAMGGSASEEFLAPAAAGEDTFAACSACDYAANTEAVAVTPPAPGAAQAAPASFELDTPDTTTVASLVQCVNRLDLLGTPLTSAATLKNVVLMVRGPGDSREVMVIGVPGDREVDLRRVEASLAPATVEPLSADQFSEHPGLVRGYIGPQQLRQLGYRYLVDTRVVEGSSWVTGANRVGRHAAHVVMGRDFRPDGVIAAAEVRAGDPCPRCGAPLRLDRGIEIGHIFQLGRKYSDAFSLDALGPAGELIRITMGSYGIGVSRAVAVIAEQTVDSAGLCWPAAVAPYSVHLIPVGRDGAALLAAEGLAADLEQAGFSVLLDDRELSPGVRFADADLIGIPTIVILGRGLAQGEVEVKDRRTGERRMVALHDLVSDLAQSSVADPRHQ